MRIRSISTPMDFSTTRMVAGLGDPRAGVAVLRLVKATRRRDEYKMFCGLNRAIGGDPEVLTGNTSAVQERRFAQGRYPARGIRHLIVTSAEDYNPVLLRRLAGFCDDVGIQDLWLVSHDPLDPETCTEIGRLVEQATLEELLEAMPAASQMPAAPRPLLPDGIVLPEVDAVVARAEARRRLGEQQFAAYDHLWTGAFTATVQLIDGLGEDPTDTQAAEHLQELLEGCHNRPEMRAVCHGLQAALLTRGLRLARFDLNGLLARAAGRPTRAQHAPLHFERLWAYARPWRAAVVVLYAARMTVQQIQQVPIDGIDGRLVTCGDEVFELPAAGVPLVHAQLLLRRNDTSCGREPLIVHDEDLERVQDDAIVRQLQAAAAEVGFPMEHAFIERTAHRSAAVASLVRVQRFTDVRLDVDLTVTPRPDTTPDDPNDDGGRAELGGLIRRRRLEMDVTPDELCRHLSIRRPALAHIEETGRLDALSGQQMLDLAAHLELDLPRLLQARPAGADADARALGSLLFKAKALLPWEIICDEAGWEMHRAIAAAEQLDLALEQAGLALRETRGKVGIVAQHDTIDVETARRILRRHRSRRTLGAADARQLLHAVDPNVTLTTRPERARQRLRAAGLLVATDETTLSQDVVFSLGLAQEGGGS